jgi:hypothetical protein
MSVLGFTKFCKATFVYIPIVEIDIKAFFLIAIYRHNFKEIYCIRDAVRKMLLTNLICLSLKNLIMVEFAVHLNSLNFICVNLLVLIILSLRFSSFWVNKYLFSCTFKFVLIKILFYPCSIVNQQRLRWFNDTALDDISNFKESLNSIFNNCNRMKF